jgi:hypothetical protein
MPDAAERRQMVAEVVADGRITFTGPLTRSVKGPLNPERNGPECASRLYLAPRAALERCRRTLPSGLGRLVTT